MMSKQELEYKVLKWLEHNPKMTQRQLAKELGVSLGKSHYLINALIQVGWVKLAKFKRSDNKMGYMYLLTPKGINEKAKITKRFLARKENEYQQLKHEIEQLKTEVRRL
ncbi:MAG: MarR family EPS-associated transcriptional regulator [Porticoccaceae bacterium]